MDKDTALKMAYEAFEKRIKENEPHLNLKSDKEGFIDNTVEQKFWDFLAGWNACKEALNQEQENVSKLL
jgi:hypothetical protein